MVAPDTLHVPYLVCKMSSLVPLRIKVRNSQQQHGNNRYLAPKMSVILTQFLICRAPLQCFFVIRVQDLDTSLPICHMYQTNHATIARQPRVLLRLCIVYCLF